MYLHARLIALILAAIAGPALALPGDQQQPIHVAADSASFDEKTGTAVYRGTVQVTQGSLQIWADELQLSTDKNGAVQKVVARGKPARFQQKPDPAKGLVEAEAEDIEYDTKAETIVLTRKARMKQDSSSFQGSTIRYNIAQQRIDAKGDSSSRVMLVFPPQAPAGKDSKDTQK